MDRSQPLVVESVDELATMLGREIAKSDWLSVTQDRILAFAEATGDDQWIHVSPERAQRESPYRSTIAHGFLTLSLFSQMLRSAFQVRDARLTINYGLNRVRFPAAVPAGSRVRATFSIQAFKKMADAAEVTLSVVVECESLAKPCCVAEWVLRYHR